MREYDVLHLLEFDSNRKCMSIIVRERKEDSEIILYSKGADSAIYANLVHPAQSHRRVFSLSSSTAVSPAALQSSGDGSGENTPMSVLLRKNEAFVKRLTQDHLDMYARLGLRILCLAKRVRLVCSTVWAGVIEAFFSSMFVCVSGVGRGRVYDLEGGERECRAVGRAERLYGV